MAKARIGKSGLTVKVSLSFQEAAALKALLARVDHETDPGINEATTDLFWALSNVREDIDADDAFLWPQKFDAFGGRPEPLVTKGT